MRGPSWGIYSPLPPRLYGSPLKMGDFSGALAYLAQSQYWNINV